MNKRPNFYIILDLDSSVSDWAKIESTITIKRRIWSTDKNQGTPAKRRKAEQYLKLIPEMEILFKDTDARKQEAATAKKEKNADQKEKINELIRLIKMFDSSEVLTQKDIILLQRNTDKVFSESEIKKHLKKYGFTVEQKTNKRKEEKREKLESSIAKNITNLLDIIGHDSLYLFLGVNSGSPAENLHSHADKLYDELSRSGKTDSETKNNKDLYALARTVFADEAEKNKYDNTLADEILLPLNKRLEIAGRDKFIDAVEISDFLKEASTLGVNNEVALGYLNALAKKRKWFVQQGEVTRSAKLRTCGYCNTMADSENDQACRSCGQKLIQPCPSCNTPIATEYVTCTHCGCYKGDAPYVNSLFKQGESNLKDGNYDKASELFEKALSYWKDWKPAIDNNKITHLLKQESVTTLDVIVESIRTKNLEKANNLLKIHEQKFSNTSIIKLKAEVKNGLHKASLTYQKAEKIRLSGNTEAAFDKYEEVLMQCTDYSSALSALASIPPSEPSELSGKWRDSLLHLTWSESDARGKITYRLIRATNRHPLDDADGEIVAETALTKADDLKIKKGMVYYYAIFSIRASVLSNKFTTAGPFIKIPEVLDLQAQSGDKQVSLTWELPEGCLAVEIWRKVGFAPNKRGDGKKRVVTSNALLDSGLINNRRYGYFIVTIYPDPSTEDRTLHSKGKTVYAKPSVPPKPITDLQVIRKDRVVFLSWQPTEFDVQIRMAKSISSITSGQIFSTNNLDRIGRPVPITSKAKSQLTLKTQGRVFFIPFSINSDIAVLGEPVSITMMDEVGNITTQVSGNNIYLKWDWPKGADEVLVAYAYDDYPIDAEDTRAIRKRVTRSEYSQKNFYELRSTGRKKHFFTIYVTDIVSNIYSNGISIIEDHGQGVRVNYKVFIDKTFFRKINSVSIILSSSMDISLDNVLVIFKKSSPPLKKDDGITLLEKKHINLENGQAVIELPKNKLTEHGFVKLFFRNDTDAKLVRLTPPIRKFMQV